MSIRNNTFGRTLPTFAILIAALAAGLGLWLGSRAFVPSQPALATGLLYPSPRAVPDFALTRADGTPLTLSDWRGRWTLVFFGFTNCPDVCPTTLGTLKQAWAEIGKRGLADRVRVDFVSVDPQRDTPDQLAKYVGYFSPDFIAATGTDEELTKLTRSLGLVYARTPSGNGDYSVDHSAAIVIIDPQGRLVGLFRPPLDAAKIAADMAALAGNS